MESWTRADLTWGRFDWPILFGADLPAYQQTRTQMSEDTLESHIIYGFKRKYLLNRKVNLV